jgi:hypothetical protein
MYQILHNKTTLFFFYNKMLCKEFKPQAEITCYNYLLRSLEMQTCFFQIMFNDFSGL